MNGQSDSQFNQSSPNFVPAPPTSTLPPPTSIRLVSALMVVIGVVLLVFGLISVLALTLGKPTSWLVIRAPITGILYLIFARAVSKRKKFGLWGAIILSIFSLAIPFILGANFADLSVGSYAETVAYVVIVLMLLVQRKQFTN